MGFRGSTLRSKVFMLVIALIALWFFAAYVTVRDGLALVWVQWANAKVYEPAEPLLKELQIERRLAQVYLADPHQSRDALDAQERKAAMLGETFMHTAQGWQARQSVNAEATRRVGETGLRLEELAKARESINNRKTLRSDAMAPYGNVITSLLAVCDSLGQLDDEQIATTVGYLIDLEWSWELMSQEDALLAGSIAAGKMTNVEHAQFTQLVGAHRFSQSTAYSRLYKDDRDRYDVTVNGADFTHFRETEDRVIYNGHVGSAPPISAPDWQKTTGTALGEFNGMVTAGGDAVVNQAIPVATWVIVRLVLATGLGFAVVVAALRTARAHVRQMEMLRDAARDLASKRLPSVVERLGRGEPVDMAAEAPPLSFGKDELGQVGQAFNAVQETAVRTAVEQAELRRSVRDVFLSIARRSQGLIHRQIGELGEMERKEEDPTKLEALFRVDHLATRMRRNAENLIVLSGSSPGRAWRRDVPMVDVLRGAVQEVEDYARVTVLPIGSVGLAGRAVGDIIHLLAELIENALSFSPPHTGVQVSGQMVANGYAVEIEDRGLGMTPDELASANEHIASQPEFRLTGTPRLGLFVVSRLTERHGVRVHLKESAYGGTTAVVLIPRELVTDGEGGAPSGGGAPRRNRRSSQDAHAASAVAVADPIAPPMPPAAPLTTSTSGATQEHPVSLPRRADRSGSEPTPGRDAIPSSTPRQSPVGTTETGLPVRVRQANLHSALQESSPRSLADSGDGGLVRPPEEIRKKMSSYQSGTRRGRFDAARLADGDPEAPPSAADE